MGDKFLLLLLFIFLSTFLFANKDSSYNRDEFNYQAKKNRKILIQFKDQFYDPYSDDIFYDPPKMEVDHIVPLKEAWDLGAKNWDKSIKSNFANDSENLILVSKSCNRSKGSKSLSEWLPLNQKFHAEYSNRYLLIINKYNLKQ